MSDRTNKLGHQSSFKKESYRLKIKIDGLIKALRENLDPYADISELKTEIIANQAYELAEETEAYKKVQAALAKVNKDLGE